MGTRESVPWFVAYIFMTAMSGMFDYVLLPDAKLFDMKTVAVFFVLNFVSISAMIYVLLWYFSQEKNKLRDMVESKSRAVATEKELADRLLLNILPPSIAERLKRQETSIADGHADVSVMFADIVNFTHLSEEMSPNETVSLLNELFSEFDNLAERYGVEKIKTIGDAYMIAGGLVNKTGPYVDNTALLALDMQAVVARHKAPNGEQIWLRVGIATGPVVAGVIGRRKFNYDLWGDTVNIASRMCTEAEPGSIQVDSVTYRRLHNRFHFDTAHQIQVKGKGPMQVFNLLSTVEDQLGGENVVPISEGQHRH
jgi:class 3 adenylate cyclase